MKIIMEDGSMFTIKRKDKVLILDWESKDAMPLCATKEFVNFVEPPKIGEVLKFGYDADFYVNEFHSKSKIVSIEGCVEG